MNNFFVAVGGTGQQVALAYLKLAKLCGFKPASFFLVDSDVKNPVTDAISSTAERMRNVNVKTIEPVPDYINDNTTLNDLFSTEDMGKLRSVMSVLFDENELGIKIRTGMYGSPCVGATALATNIKTENLKVVKQKGDQKQVKLSEMINMIPTNSTVTICGSIVGGTGAGGVPTLARYIKNKCGDNNRTVRIFIIDFLKWFELVNNSEKNKQFSRNSESGVYYLKDEIAKDVDGCILFGLEKPLQVDTQDIGEQNEKRHLITLLTAVVTNNSFHCNEFFPNRGIYGYVVPDEGLNTSNTIMYMPVDDRRETKVTLCDIIKMAKYIIKVLKFFKKYINECPPYFSFTPGLVLPNKLKKTVKDLSTRTDKSTEKVYSKISKEIDNRIDENKDENIENYSYLLNWYDKLCENSNDGGIFKFEKSNSDDFETRIHPMSLLRKCLKYTRTRDITDEKMFVERLVVGIRKAVNKKYLHKVFGEMNFLEE